MSRPRFWGWSSSSDSTSSLIRRTGKRTGSVVDRYRYPPQECEIRAGDELKLRDQARFGEVVAADRLGRTIDVRKGPGTAETHPSSIFSHQRISPEQPAAALYRLGEQVANGGVDAAPGAAVDLLLGTTGRGVVPSPPTGSVGDYAVRMAARIPDTTLPVQGPPGSGKTHTGARDDRGARRTR